MKILLVNYRYFISGGPERYLFNIKNELELLHHEVIPFSLNNVKNVESKYSGYFSSDVCSSATFYEDYDKSIKTQLKVLGRQFYSYEVKRNLGRLIKNEKPDVCYLLHFVNKLSPSVILACKDMGVPIIHRISDYTLMCPQGGFYVDGKYCDDCQRNKFAVVRKKCVRGSYPASLIKYGAIKFQAMLGIKDIISRFVCTNEFMRQKLIDFGYESAKLVTIPTFTFTQKDAFFEKEIDESGSVIQFICAGNIDESKGTFDLLKAIALINDDIKKHCHFIIIGGRIKTEIDNALRLIKELRIENCVDLSPMVKPTELEKLYIKSDVSILPARWVENLPNVLLESLNYNLPVIVPDLGSFKESIDDTVGWKFKPWNVHSLAKTIEFIVKNRSEIIKRKNNCAKYVENRFSREKHIEKLVGLFNEVKKR